MSSGNHFIQGIPLVGSLSLTASDLDTSTMGLRLAATRGLLYFNTTAPTISESPDWEHLIWCEPTTYNGEDCINLKVYSVSLDAWIFAISTLPDLTHILPRTIPVSALYATMLNVGMVPVVTVVGGLPLVQWQTFTPINIPVGSMMPGNAYDIIQTNGAASGAIWGSFSSLLANLGKVIPLSSITQSGAILNQVLVWNGTNWVPGSKSEGTPDISASSWNTSTQWLEVYDTTSPGTVRKTRKNFYDTLPLEYTSAILTQTTTFLGYLPATNVANIFSIQNITDLVVVSTATAYPAKFYSTVESITGNFPTYGLALFISGVPHGLNGTPMLFGGKFIAGAGGSDPAGTTYDLNTVHFKVGIAAQYVFTVIADSTKIYLRVISIDSDGITSAAQPGAPIQLNIIVPYTVQLFAYL